MLSIIVSAALSAIAVTAPEAIRLERDKKKWRDEHNEWMRIVDKSHQKYWEGYEETMEAFKQEQKELRERLVNSSEKEMYEYWSKEYAKSCRLNKILFTEIAKERGLTEERLLKIPMEKFK